MKFRVFVIVLAVIPFFSLTADDGPAVLARGPVYHEGIEYLGVNALPAEYAEYAYNDDIITVYFTYETIVLPASIENAECSVSNLYALVSESQKDRKVYVYMDDKGWSAFLAFPEESEYSCRFIEAYINRQNYFNNISRDENLFSFPAVLNIK